MKTNGAVLAAGILIAALAIVVVHLATGPAGAQTPPGLDHVSRLPLVRGGEVGGGVPRPPTPTPRLRPPTPTPPCTSTAGVVLSLAGAG